MTAARRARKLEWRAPELRNELGAEQRRVDEAPRIEKVAPEHLGRRGVPRSARRAPVLDEAAIVRSAKARRAERANELKFPRLGLTETAVATRREQLKLAAAESDA